MMKAAPSGAAFFAQKVKPRIVTSMESPSTSLEFFDDDYWLCHEDYLTSEQADFDVAEILSLLNGTSGRLLDAPCGSGRLAARLSLLGFDVDGVDLDPRALKLARSQQRGLSQKVHYFERDLRALLELGPYDVIVSWFNSFGYFSSEDNVELLRSFSSLLKSNGQLLINTLDLHVVQQVLSEGVLSEEITVRGRTIGSTAHLEGNRLITTRVSTGLSGALEKVSSVELFTAKRWVELLQGLGFDDVVVTKRSQPSLGDPVAEITVQATR